MKSFLVYEFTCPSCSSSYIGKTCCHFKTRIEKDIKKNNKSHICKHLHFTATCFVSYNSLCFEMTDKANSKFDLKIKEALHTNWRKSFSSHPLTIGSVPLTPFCPCLFFLCCFLQFSFIYCFHYLYANNLHLLLP